MSFRAAVLGLTALLLAIWSPASSARSPGHGDVRVEGSSYEPLVRPAKLILVDDGSFYLAGLRWRDWGRRTAYASGRLWDGEPCPVICSHPKGVFHPARMRVNRLHRCDGNRFYSRSVIWYRAHHRWHRFTTPHVNSPC